MGGSLAAVALVALFGCVNLPSISAGQMGCDVNEVTILDERRGPSSRKWTALCNGKAYACSSGLDGQDATCKLREDHGPP